MDPRPAPTSGLPLATAALLLMAGTGAAWSGWGMLQPEAAVLDQSEVRPIPTANRSAEAENPLTETDWIVLDALRLQGSKPAPSAPPALTSTQARGLVLLGTLVATDGSSEGLFRAEDGRLRVAAAGDRVGDARVELVSDGEARLNINGRIVTLQTERKRNASETDKLRRITGGTR